jgi:biopolymer transport protein TolQ
MAKFVLVVLLGFSVASWAIIAERWRAFSRAQRESDAFLDKFKKGGGLAAIQDATAPLHASPLAHLVSSRVPRDLLEPAAAPRRGSGHGVRARSRAAQARVGQVTELERSLGIPGDLRGRDAVHRIVRHRLGDHERVPRHRRSRERRPFRRTRPGSPRPWSRRPRGLFAAIPALIGYNHFMRQLRLFEAGMDEFSADMIHRVLGRRS